LEEGGEGCTGCDWDIISINGRPFEEEPPIAPMTLIANHFELDGGTATGMSPLEFECALRESVLFWKDKALLAPGFDEEEALAEMVKKGLTSSDE
jgi:hypothetical protein